MASLLIRVFSYTGIACYLFLLAAATIASVTHPASALYCNVRASASDFDPLVYPIHCTSKIQYLLVVITNAFNPLSLAIWVFLSFVVFVLAVIFLSLTYKPAQSPHG
ncbi:phosphoglycerol transferase MdoB-like AlkP superfamily enzyme [Bradyrhizobium elkanii]|jgi:hypothetical protein|nr:phosphoglycerol transferase MdoB-like AlkP superfamily enzyme [Bradyrhizobium elkanii]